ncbi:MAG: hypothetical protein P4L99_00600 [Chthoniobacter sp.]|nr:hypothetical protein [Chthoniobacter sp.]
MNTSAVLLALNSAEGGAGDTVIDADPNKPVSWCGRRPGKPQNHEVIDAVTEQTVIRTIEQKARGSAFVIVDPGGAASKMVVHAMSCAQEFVAEVIRFLKSNTAKAV